MSYQKKELREWHMPLHRDEITLKSAYELISAFANTQQEVPLIVRLIENPHYQLPGFALFQGAVSLRQHDYIHLILGRGFTLADEAFVIGFTMGTTDKVSTWEAWLYCLASRYLYPKAYCFNKDHARIFYDAVAAGYISACHPLDTFCFDDVVDLPLRDIRARLGLETDLLQSCYEVEARRFPHLLGSRRLARAGGRTAFDSPHVSMRNQPQLSSAA
ncbi:MAG: hypothetical protein ACAI35_16945 [Candidatus Methylacidiphilales bacterium]|nr:hypothetical protein [Candidatus Methylacidiphilales bacterium]